MADVQGRRASCTSRPSRRRSRSRTTCAASTSCSSSADTLAKIFQGDDQDVGRRRRSRPTTPASTCPTTDISVAHRSDGSGTTTQLHQVPRRPRRPTRGRSAAVTPSTGRPTPRPATATPAWPRSSSDTDGAIGYVDLSDADGARACSFALDQEQGRQVRRPDARRCRPRRSPAPRSTPTSPTTRSNAAGCRGLPDHRADLHHRVPRRRPTRRRGETLKGWLNYILTDGQDLADDVGFAPLPAEPAGEGDRPARQDQDRLTHSPTAWRHRPPLRTDDRAAGLVDARPRRRRMGRPRLPRSSALVAGLARARDPRADRVLHDQGGVAGVPRRGLLVRHSDEWDPERGQVRRAGVHLRHAAHVVRSRWSSRCR